ncbi:hypothetical protein C9I57_25420 [Trinickia symbiotica]|uniref:Uncharacterized protein n=2 Tax=Trinickia symbiotica TaxID=863227 RepID=A0A2T3XMX8_9BURK|nr:hypothetical protein C9I57_25420 [Trinickia symbiotica]
MATAGEVAAWVQGVGSLLAVIAAVGVYAKQYQDKKADDLEQTCAFVQAIKHEISTVWNRHIGRIGTALTHVPDGKHLDGLVPITPNSLVTYSNASARVGHINDEALRTTIVSVYAMLRDYFSDLDLNNRLLANIEHFRNTYPGEDINQEMDRKRYAMVILARSMKKCHAQLQRDIPELMANIDAWLQRKQRPATTGGIMRFDLETFKTWAELALTCASFIALPVGGWWVYHNFSVEDTHEINPNISVTAEFKPYDDERRLLIVHVRPKNVGKVPIELDGGKNGDIEVQVKVIPSKMADGPINLDKLPVQYRVSNFVSRYQGGYIMEPGIDYEEVLTFVVPKDTTYLVNAEMAHFEVPDDEVDGSYVIKVD